MIRAALVLLLVLPLTSCAGLAVMNMNFCGADDPVADVFKREPK